MIRRILSSLCGVFCLQALATPPAEMASMSIQELLNMHIEDHHDTHDHQEMWSASVSYIGRRYDGYLNGSQKLSYPEVLYTPDRDQRTQSNYPILPTEITQQAAIISINREFSPWHSLTLDIPYIQQSTDHLSIVPGYHAFNITSRGLGDIRMRYTDVLYRNDNQLLQYSAGVSLPTGSIAEKGDTPRAPGDQQLPYTMQLGSGTWDIPLGLYYRQSHNHWSWGLNLHGVFRTGHNNRHYRLGNHASLAVWGQWHVSPLWQPKLKLVLEQSGRIHGRDNEITLPGQFSYPANITDPNNFGGKRIKLGFGSCFQLSPQHKLSAEFAVPIYQNLNNVQVKEKAQFSIKWDAHF